MKTTGSTRGGGFTLIELMVTVVIIGILSSIAIPSLIKYIRKSKSSEARLHLRKVYEGANSYYLEEAAGTTDIGITNSQFPASETTTPAVSCCTDTGGERCMPNDSIWQTPTWTGLKFSMPDPHYYQYDFDSEGTGIDAEFTAYAYGDLDCDEDFSTFRMWGTINDVGGDPVLSAGASRQQELE